MSYPPPPPGSPYGGQPPPPPPPPGPAAPPSYSPYGGHQAPPTGSGSSSPYGQYGGGGHGSYPGGGGGFQPQPPSQGSGQSICGTIGIVLFVLGVICGIIGIVIVMPIAAQLQGQPPDPDNLPEEAMLAGFLMLGAGGLNLLGLIVSAIGFVESQRGKATVWVGICLNGLPVLGCGGLCLLGMLMGG